MVLVEKKDGSKQFCMGYRKLNTISIKDAYPPSRINDSQDALSCAALFSSLDLTRGYWMAEEVWQKSAFVTEGGLC